MKGLIIKDFYNLSGQKKIIILLGLFYIGLALFTDSGFLMMQVMVLACGMLSVSAFSYDEFAKWDSYALSLPVTRKEIVAARYLFAVILTGTGVLAAMALGGISLLIRPSVDMAAFTTSILVSAAVVLLLLSITLPLCYKFGLERGRTMTMVLMMVLVFMGTALPGIVSSWASEQEQGTTTIWVIGLLLLLDVLTVVLSYSISTRIYEKKDF